MHYEEKKKHIDQDLPLVSVITPVYNTASYIEKNITSVKEQTYQNWEHIIIDDGSLDNSVSIIKNHASKDDRIVFSINKSNQGAAVSRNKATKLARGKYIAFLDADDLWHPEKLTKQVHLMEENTCDVSLTSYLQIDPQGNTLHKRIRAIPILAYKKQHNNNYIGNLTGMYNVKALGKIIAPNIRTIGIQEDLAYYRVHKKGMSANKLKLIKHNYYFYRTYLKYSRGKSLVSLLRFFVEYFIIRPKYIEKF